MGRSRLGWAMASGIVAMALPPASLMRIRRPDSISTRGSGRGWVNACDIATIYTERRADDWTGCATAL
jgi:hypothetical protein